MSIAKTKTAKRVGCLTALAASAVLLLGVTAAPASAAQQWRIDSLANTTVKPGGEHEYIVQVTNVGDADMDGSAIDLTGTLPAGMTAVDAVLFPEPAFDPFEFNSIPCTAGDGVSPIAEASDFKCTNSVAVPAAKNLGQISTQRLRLTVKADSEAAGTLTATFAVSGGGAPPASTVDPTLVSATLPDFGIDAFDSQLVDLAGNPFTQAGGTPDAIVTQIDINTLTNPVPQAGVAYPVEPVKDILVDTPPGFLGNPTAVEQCTGIELVNSEGFLGKPLCPAGSQVGTVLTRINGGSIFPDAFGPFPLFSIAPPPGVPARFGFNLAGTVIVFDVQLRSDGDYGLTVASRNIPVALGTAGSVVTFWGQPGSPAHDSERACPGQLGPAFGGATCKGNTEAAFLRTPTSCADPGQGLPWSIHTDSWMQPGASDALGVPDLGDPAWKSRSIASHEPPGYPATPVEWGEELAMTGCSEIPVRGKLTARPTTIDTESPSGLEVHVEVPGAGLEKNPQLAASSSDIKGVKVTLPEGVTLNPSQAEGLGVCTPAQYESTELSFHPTPGKGCPDDSKIGTVEVHTPLLEETLLGDVYIAQQDDPATSKPGAENPFDSLLALYIVIKNPERGILVKLAGKVEPDEKSGRIVTSFDDVPQLPFSSFDFRFREGARAPLVTPPICGTYQTKAEFTGWSDPDNPITSTSSFEIVHGIGGGPCPPGGIPPFNPGFSAGAINNNAGSYSPFNMRLTRNDGEQDMTRFSAVLPPGVLGKLAGVAKCPEAAIAVAKGKTGRQEQADPSCPANSQIGRSLVGAGVGSVLTYVPGKLYLGGPFHGDPLSVIAITPAVAGPFDVGTVVVHEALTLNPKTAEVEVDGAASDPIPHILKGIPAKLRDLRVYVDRPDFTLNPTSCDPSATEATLFGSYADVFSPADDVPVALSDRFQAASCAALGFKPGLRLRLKGGAHRGDHPGLSATYRPRRGDANAAGVVVRLPRSAFLEQGHIRTVCTRVQFAADACPKAAQYGYIRAWTPLLDEPLQGPVYLRSSDNKLPDLVFDLHGLVDVEVATRIDSIRGGVRASVDQIPDAPLSKVLLTMQGGRKGLIVNSRDLCATTNRASAQFDAHNGKIHDFRPKLRPDCGKGRKGKHKRR